MTAHTTQMEYDAHISFFTDETECCWEVREIRDPILPERRGFYVRPEFAAGWLLFISANERRRMAPFPPGWRLATQDQLRRWCAEALPVRSSRTG